MRVEVEVWMWSRFGLKANLPVITLAILDNTEVLVSEIASGGLSGPPEAE